MIAGCQIRAARALLGWNQARLAEASGVPLSTLKRMEASSGPLQGSARNAWKIERAIEAAGIVMIAEDPQLGFGVRLKKKMLRP